MFGVTKADNANLVYLLGAKTVKNQVKQGLRPEKFSPAAHNLVFPISAITAFLNRSISPWSLHTLHEWADP